MQAMRVAIVGCGQIARVHVGALHQISGVEICAVCDQDTYRARELVNLAKGAHPYHDLAALLRQERPDAVHILTPPATHARLAIQAMEAGCHVLVEKPMALSLREADSMIAAARVNQVKLCTNHNYLFKPSVIKARRLVESGAIGQVVYVDSYYGLSGEGGSYGGPNRTHWAWRLPGGVHTNFLPHLIYLQLAFLQQVEKVAGVSVLRNGAGPETELSVLLEGSGASGIMTVSMRTQPYAKFVHIYGTKGIIHADLVREVCTIHKELGLPRLLSKVLFSVEESIQLASGTVANTAAVALGKMKNMPEMPIILGEFYDSIRNGTEPPAPGEAGRKMIEVMEMVWAKSPAEPPAVISSRASVPRSPETDVERTIAQTNALPGKVLVTGATGFLGRHLVEALSRCGVDVAVLVRDKSRASLELEHSAQLITGDLRDPSTLAEAMRDVSVVFHCAAITANNVPWSTHYETNVLGTEAVLQAALQAGKRRVIHVSSVIVYGLGKPRRNGLITESSPHARDTDKWAHYMRSKIAAEKLAFKYSREAGLPVTVLRVGILYGPGAKRQSVRSGLVQLGPVRVLAGGGHNTMPYTYVGNAVDCLLLAAISPEATGQAYNVVDEPQISVDDAIKRSANITGERVRLVRVPPFVFAGAARLFELKHSLARTDVPPKLSRYVIRSACRDIRYDTAKAREQLGWQSQVTLEEGMRRAFADNS